MLYRTLGIDHTKVSQLGFGLMRLPLLDEDVTHIDEKKAISLIRYAIDNGVNYIDTAFPYHGTGMANPGFSEPLAAKMMKDGYREKINIVTKLPTWLVNKREDMDKYLDLQLQRLEVDSLDFYLLHSLNEATWNKMNDLGFQDFLDKAKQAGKIKHAGFSFHDATVDSFKKMIDSYQWDMCQIQLNYMDEFYQAGTEGLDYAYSKGIGAVVMEPLKGGNLACPLPEKAQELLNNLHPDWSNASWSLRWLLNHPAVKVILSGMNKMDQLKDNITTTGVAEANKLSERDVDALQQVKEILQSRVKVPCTGCHYCMPCPFGLDIPRNFELLNDYYRFDDANNKHHTIAMLHSTFDESKWANRCQECGKCEKHCPQGIEIRKMLKEVCKAFEMNAVNK